MKIHKRLFIYLFFLSIISCGKKEQETIPEEIIPRNEMVQILTDMHLAEASFQLENLAYSDSTRQRAYGFYNYIYEKHKITDVKFRKSFKYYVNHPEIFSEMYQEVITELSKRQATAQKRNPG